MSGWYSPAQVNHYRRKHILWVLENYWVLLHGHWPSEPTQGGYTDAPVTTHAINAKAPHIDPAEVMGEVTTRLEHCGSDGVMALMLLADQEDRRRVAAISHLSEWDVEYHVNRAINYSASGPCRRWVICKLAECEHLCAKQGRKPKEYEEWVEVGGLHLMRYVR